MTGLKNDKSWLCKGFVVVYKKKNTLAEDKVKEKRKLCDGENVDCKTVKMKQSKYLKLDICPLFETLNNTFQVGKKCLQILTSSNFNWEDIA
jgi:hypothetical protein